MCGNYLVSEDFSCPLESDRSVLQEMVTHTHHPMLGLFHSSRAVMPHGSWSSLEEKGLLAPSSHGRGILLAHSPRPGGSFRQNLWLSVLSRGLLAERPRKLFWNRLARYEGLSMCPESSGTCLILPGLMVAFLVWIQPLEYICVSRSRLHLPPHLRVPDSSPPLLQAHITFQNDPHHERG